MIQNIKRRVSLKQIFFATILGLSFLMTACVAVDPAHQSAENDVKEKWGIEVTSIRLSAAGHMVDFRYRVLDKKKAEALFVEENKPYLIDQQSGKILSVPNKGKVGPLRSANMSEDDRIYWMFFGNTGRLITSGSIVTVAIGDFRVKNLVVQ